MSENDNTDAPKTRTYFVKVFGQAFLIHAASKPQVRAHLRRRVLAETEIRVADFDDGREAERLGIDVEYASGEPDSEDDPALQGGLGL